MSIIREITQKAEKYLNEPEIMLFVGARQTGKTTILRQLQVILQKTSQTSYFLNLEDPEYLELLDASPKNLLKIFNFDLNQKTFVFIDEIQYLKNPTNFLKYFYDEYQGKIKLLVSGSLAFYIDQKFHDSLAGRKKIFPVRSLSFREFLKFKNELELYEKDWNDLSLNEIDKMKLYYSDYVVFGGYPKVALADLSEKKDLLQEIGFSYVKKDIFESGVRQEENFYRLLKILAQNIGGIVNVSELASTLRVSAATVDRYFYILQKSFHVSFVRPFFNNVRKELTKMSKVYFYDLGLRNFFLGNFDAFSVRSDKGAVLENAVYRQLLEKYDEDEIKFWRTQDGHEVDFVTDKRALEVKFSFNSFQKKKYELFIRNYQEKILNVVAYEKGGEEDVREEVFYPWNI